MPPSKEARVGVAEAKAEHLAAGLAELEWSCLRAAARPHHAVRPLSKDAKTKRRIPANLGHNFRDEFPDSKGFGVAPAPVLRRPSAVPPPECLRTDRDSVFSSFGSSSQTIILNGTSCTRPEGLRTKLC
jgi:hypothetical protein